MSAQIAIHADGTLCEQAVITRDCPQQHRWVTSYGELKRELVLERRVQADETVVIEVGKDLALFTPPIGQDYWAYRVRVADGQAVVGFGKFGTIGIGFAVEEDWNTNLPYLCETEKILGHIWHNSGPNLKGKKAKALVREAIAMIQAAAHEDRGTDPEKDVIS